MGLLLRPPQGRKAPRGFTISDLGVDRSPDRVPMKLPTRIRITDTTDTDGLHIGAQSAGRQAFEQSVNLTAM